MLINLFDSVAYWCSSMNIYAGRFQLMLLVINSDWYWLLLIDAGAFWCRLIMIDTVLLIDANCCSSKLIDAGWCWFMLIDAVLWRLILIDANWQAAKLTRWHDEMMKGWHDDMVAWWHGNSCRKFPNIAKNCKVPESKSIISKIWHNLPKVVINCQKLS